MYIYFYNPLATKIVKYLPENLAPNLITLFGFIFASLPFFVLFSNFGTKLENDPDKNIARWFFFLEAFCYLMYRIFDELDGKQARKTSSSSPLGLLFDHGCDSFSIGFQMLILAKCLQVGDNFTAVLTCCSGAASFHFSTLEEYYTGGLFLGICNGVSDGSFLIIFLYLVMGCFGN
jgi:ethanolaminephosphotransferase